MSDSLADLLATDVELDSIARREDDGTRDLVLAELALLAAAVDDVPMLPAVSCSDVAGMTSVRKGGWALSVTVALMVTSSGVAAAVSDSPIAPLRYVTTQVWKLGPHGDGDLPGWQLDGAMPITTGPRSGRPGGRAERSATDLEGYTSTAGVARPGGGLAGPSDSTTGDRSGTGPGTGTGSGTGPGSWPGWGTGGRPPSSTGGSGPHDVNLGNRPPRGGHGRTPGNVGGPGSGSGTGDPGTPSAPQDPGLPTGDRNVGRPAPGPVPVVGTGHCRVDSPDLPGTPGWSAPASSLPVCTPHPAPAAAPPVVAVAPPQVSPAGLGSSTTRAAPQASVPSRSIP